MSQSFPEDFPIDPTTTSGTALAEILNRFADSVNSSNSGASAPTETFPGMIWLDTSTTPSTLRMRNSANTGWDTIPVASGSGGAGAPFLLPDGTVAKPGLAFAAEPGLGLFRQSTSLLGFASTGKTVLGLNASNDAQTTMTMRPRVTGVSQLNLQSGADPGSGPHLSLSAGASNGSVVMRDASGAASTTVPILYNAGQHSFTGTAAFANNVYSQQVGDAAFFAKSTTSGNATLVLDKAGASKAAAILGYHNGVSRWQLNLGNAAAGADFEVSMYNDAGAYVLSPLSISRASGKVLLQTNNNISLHVADFGAGGANILMAASGGSKYFRVINNELQVVNNANSAYIMTLRDDGRLYAKYGHATQAAAGSGAGSNAFNIWHDAGQFLFIDATNCGKFAYDPSDERIKKDIVALDMHEDTLMALRPLEYSYSDVRGIWKDDGVRHWGWSAQQVKAAMPIAAYGEEVPLPEDDMEPWAPMAVSDRPILALTVLHVQDLINRVRALEGATAP